MDEVNILEEGLASSERWEAEQSLNCQFFEWLGLSIDSLGRRADQRACGRFNHILDSRRERGLVLRENG